MFLKRRLRKGLCCCPAGEEDCSSWRSAGDEDCSSWRSVVVEEYCGFNPTTGSWKRYPHMINWQGTDEEEVDVVLLVGDDKLPAHSSRLCSDFVDERFSARVQAPEVLKIERLMQGVNLCDAEEFLLLVYNEVDSENLTNASDVLSIARRLKCSELVDVLGKSVAPEKEGESNAAGDVKSDSHEYQQNLLCQGPLEKAVVPPKENQHHQWSWWWLVMPMLVVVGVMWAGVVLMSAAAGQDPLDRQICAEDLCWTQGTGIFHSEVCGSTEGNNLVLGLPG